MQDVGLDAVRAAQEPHEAAVLQGEDSTAQPHGRALGRCRERAGRMHLGFPVVPPRKQRHPLRAGHEQLGPVVEGTRRRSRPRGPAPSPAGALGPRRARDWRQRQVNDALAGIVLAPASGPDGEPARGWSGPGPRSRTGWPPPAGSPRAPRRSDRPRRPAPRGPAIPRGHGQLIAGLPGSRSPAAHPHLDAALQRDLGPPRAWGLGSPMQAPSRIGARSAPATGAKELTPGSPHELDGGAARSTT